MPRDPSTPLSKRLVWALRRRCPRCGAPAFESYFSLKRFCDSCGIEFEREPGYWAGALIVNTAVIFATFVVTLTAGVVLTWPNVPWMGLLVVLIAINGVVPVVFYPQSKTVWSAIEMGWNPLEPDEAAAATQRANPTGN